MWSIFHALFVPSEVKSYHTNPAALIIPNKAKRFSLPLHIQTSTCFFYIHEVNATTCKCIYIPLKYAGVYIPACYHDVVEGTRTTRGRRETISRVNHTQHLRNHNIEEDKIAINWNSETCSKGPYIGFHDHDLRRFARYIHGILLVSAWSRPANSHLLSVSLTYLPLSRDLTANIEILAKSQNIEDYHINSMCFTIKSANGSIFMNGNQNNFELFFKSLSKVCQMFTPKYKEH